MGKFVHHGSRERLAVQGALEICRSCYGAASKSEPGARCIVASGEVQDCASDEETNLTYIRLYAARFFPKGSVICCGSSAVGSWTLHSLSPPQPDYTLVVELRHAFFGSREKRVQLVGDPARDLWSGMNSTKGLSIEQGPNVEASFKDENATIMDESFLTFRAVRHIEPFEELLWHYDWSDGGKSADACHPGATPVTENRFQRAL